MQKKLAGLFVLAILLLAANRKYTLFSMQKIEEKDLPAGMKAQPIREAIKGPCALDPKFVTFLYDTICCQHTISFNDQVSSAAFSPDGTKIAISSDGIVGLWNAQTGQSLGVPIPHHGRLIFSAAFSPDGTQILTTSNDGAARLWSAQTGNPIGNLMRHTGYITSATFSPDGSKIITSSLDGVVHLWDAQTTQSIGQLQAHNGPVSSVAFSPDGSKIITSSTDSTARQWNAHTGQPIGPLIRHTGPIYFAAFSPDGTKIVTALEDGTARLWDAQTGQQSSLILQHQSPALSSSVNAAKFSPDGTKIVTISIDTAKLWDAHTGQLIGPANGLEHEDVINTVAFSPDGTKIVTAGSEGDAKVWSIANIIKLHQFLDNANLDQCQLLQAFQETFKINRAKIMEIDPFVQKDRGTLPGRIQATDKQWHTFIRLPEFLQKILKVRIKEPTKKQKQ